MLKNLLEKSRYLVVIAVPASSRGGAWRLQESGGKD